MGGVISNYVFIPPQHETYSWGQQNLIQIQTASNKIIPAFYLRSPNLSERRTILYSHGNATDIGEMLPFLKILNEQLKLNVLHYDYLGYGLTKTEKPSEDGVYESIEAALFYLESEGIKRNEIIVFGTSIGSGPSVYLSSKYKGFKGLILETPFTSIARIVSGGNIFTIAWDMFPNIDRIESVDCPVFILHGDADTVVPQTHGRQLNDKVKNKYPPCWIEGAGHNNIRSQLGYRYLTVLRDFLDYLEDIKKEPKTFVQSYEPANFQSEQAQQAFAIDNSDINTTNTTNNNNNNTSNPNKK